MTEVKAANTAFVFPGQGAQAIGMGKDAFDSSPAAREVFETADAVVGFPLSKLCFEGPHEVLTDTINSQPAILTASLAYLAALREMLGKRDIVVVPGLVAGHSLGEYTALVCSGALTVADGVRLVRERGRLMKEADERSPGGMAAVLGLEDAQVEEVCREASAKGVIILANYNCPGQVVISGDEGALKVAMGLAEAKGAKKVVRLPISIAAHSPLMRPAQDDLWKAIEATTIVKPNPPLVANVTAKVIGDVDAIRGELSEQLCSSVRWTQSAQTLAASGIDTIVEIGPGSTLTGLVKRIVKGLTLINVNDMKSVEAYAAKF